MNIPGLGGKFEYRNGRSPLLGWLTFSLRFTFFVILRYTIIPIYKEVSGKLIDIMLLCVP